MVERRCVFRLAPGTWMYREEARGECVHIHVFVRMREKAAGERNEWAAERNDDDKMGERN